MKMIRKLMLLAVTCGLVGGASAADQMVTTSVGVGSTRTNITSANDVSTKKRTWSVSSSPESQIATVTFPVFIRIHKRERHQKKGDRECTLVIVST